MFETKFGSYKVAEIETILTKEITNDFESSLISDIKERIYLYYCNIRTICVGNKCSGSTKEKVQSAIDYDLLKQIKGYEKELVDYIMLKIMNSSIK